MTAGSGAPEPIGSAPQYLEGSKPAHKRRRLLVIIAVILAAALTVSLVLVLGGNGNGHSYTDGYVAGEGLGEQASEAPGMVSGSPSAICHSFIGQMPAGDDETQWLQGCVAAVKEYGPGPSTG
jgi:hypothetical protein